MEKFDWRAAQTLEDTFRKVGDINGLLNVSLDFWNKFGAGHTFETRLPKICYYKGRLKKTEDLKSFLSKNNVNIELFIREDLFEVSKNLHFIGIRFPNLSPKDFDYLERLYSDPQYFDLIDDILFDQHLLSRTLKKYDPSIREIKQTAFDEKIKQEIFDAFIHNSKTDNGEFENDFYLFYHRPDNKIVKKDSRDDFEDNVEFLIDFYNLDIAGFASAAKEFLGEDFIEFYKKDPIGNDETLKEVGVVSFDSGTFETFRDRLFEFHKSKSINPEQVSNLKKHLALQWLKEINI